GPDRTPSRLPIDPGGARMQASAAATAGPPRTRSEYFKFLLRRRRNPYPGLRALARRAGGPGREARARRDVARGVPEGLRARSRAYPGLPERAQAGRAEGGDSPAPQR